MTTLPIRPRRLWDRLLTIGLMVLLLPWSVLLLLLAALAGMATDACDGRCDYGIVTAGVAVGTVGQLVVVVAAVVIAAIALDKRRIAFWIPLAAAAAGYGLVVLDAGIVQIGVTSGSS